MKTKLKQASAISLAATFLVTLLGTAGSSAAAEHAGTTPGFSEAILSPPAAKPLDPDVQPRTEADDGIQPLPQSADPSTSDGRTPPAVAAASLEELVATQVSDAPLSDDLRCLAGAIYFEARSETLEGQLAVGRVIVARTRSGRFPDSYCGVVYQPSQFSFIHGSTMPSVDDQSRLWQRAVAMARIADAGSWQSPAEGALFFHASHVAQNGRMQRVVQVDRQYFYR